MCTSYRKTVVNNFGGYVDHYDHDSAGYAASQRLKRQRDTG